METDIGNREETIRGLEQSVTDLEQEKSSLADELAKLSDENRYAKFQKLDFKPPEFVIITSDTSLLIIISVI